MYRVLGMASRGGAWCSGGGGAVSGDGRIRRGGALPEASGNFALWDVRGARYAFSTASRSGSRELPPRQLGSSSALVLAAVCALRVVRPSLAVHACAARGVRGRAATGGAAAPSDG
jgi:hypothetical protein